MTCLCGELVSYDVLVRLFTESLLCRFQNSDGEVKYLCDAEELIRPERNTLLVSFTDLEQFNQELATAIQEEFYRLEKHYYVAQFQCLAKLANLLILD